MRLIPCPCLVPLGRRTLADNEDKRPPANARLLFPLGGFLAFLILAGLGIEPHLQAQPNAADPANSVAGATPKEQVDALKLELTNAINRVLLIVNRPVKAYVRSGNIDVSMYKPGWFHEGATKPDFNTVDVRQTQELPYANAKFVTSDLNPGVVFLGQDLEFNAMTKYFYTNRTLPKAKLTEAQMLEINRLYRIIGRCEGEIFGLKADRVKPSPAATAAQPLAADGGTEEVIPGQPLESIRKIPIQTRALYAGIAVGALLLLVVALRFLRKKPGQGS